MNCKPVNPGICISKKIRSTVFSRNTFIASIAFSHLATECNNKNHSAAFPEELPQWFIKLFTKENDTVLDPFMGSGTTLIVANRMKRNSIGIDIVSEYYDMVKEQLQPIQLYLLEPKADYAKTKSKRRSKVR